MPIAEGTAAVIGAGLAAAGTAGTNWLQAEMNKRAFRRNKQLLQMQNDFSLDMWNRTNEYNSPSAQLERLKAAGLNPLYYGLDGSSADAFESAAAAPYEPASMLNPFEGMQNFGSLLADIKVKNAQAENLAADTAKKNNENLTETQRRANLSQELEESRARIKEILSRTDLNESQRKLAEQSLDWNERLNEANLEYTESMKKLNDSQRTRIDELLEGEKLLQAKTLEEFAHRWELWRAQVEKDNALRDLTLKDIENYALIHMDSGMLGSGVSLRNLGVLSMDLADRIGKKFKKKKDE